MQNKDKGDRIEDSPLDMLLVILLEEVSKEVVMPSSELQDYFFFHYLIFTCILRCTWLNIKYNSMLIYM